MTNDDQGLRPQSTGVIFLTFAIFFCSAVNFVSYKTMVYVYRLIENMSWVVDKVKIVDRTFTPTFALIILV